MTDNMSCSPSDVSLYEETHSMNKQTQDQRTEDCIDNHSSTEHRFLNLEEQRHGQSATPNEKVRRISMRPSSKLAKEIQLDDEGIQPMQDLLSQGTSAIDHRSEPLHDLRVVQSNESMEEAD